MLVLWSFIKGFPLILNNIKPYRAVIEKSEELGIDNAALFYSEEAHTSIAEYKLLERLMYNSGAE